MCNIFFFVWVKKNLPKAGFAFNEKGGKLFVVSGSGWVFEGIVRKSSS